MRAGIRSRPWAGLDVGSYSVKLLAVMGGVAGQRYWLGETPLPPLAPGNGGRSAAEVSRAIATCMEGAELSPRAFHGLSPSLRSR